MSRSLLTAEVLFAVLENNDAAAVGYPGRPDNDQYSSLVYDPTTGDL